MNSVDKYALIPFSKYQKLLKAKNTKDTKPSPLSSYNNEVYDTPTLNSHTSPQIGRGSGEVGSPTKRDTEALNDVNTSISKNARKINNYPPPGIPSEEIKFNTKTLSDKSLSEGVGWLSYWEEL